MEVSETRNLVRDLDLTLQPRIAPRYKIWLPLATQQLRLRSLIQIIGLNLKTTVENETHWFYYTLHRSTMSSPLYTSEPIDNANPRWSCLEVPTLHATGYSSASEVVLRLWQRTAINDAASDITLFTWSISFNGLAYIGPKLPNNLENVMKENSLIFYFHGGYFAPLFCFINPPVLKKYLFMNLPVMEIRDSYTVNKLTSLKSKMQALKQQTESVQTLRIRIASGEDFQAPRYPQTLLNKLLQPRKVNKEKKTEIIAMKRELEMARFRIKLLEQEWARKMAEVRTLNQTHSNLLEENQDHGSELMEKYRRLNKDIEKIHEWKQVHIEKREIYIQLSNQLASRRRQLISELSCIYPINQDGQGKYTINNVHLPDSEELESSNDTQIAVALGFVAHATQMIAHFLNVPTRYPIIHYGSRSRVIDHITDSLPDNERQFPLFARGKDKLQFNYAVYLLNKNIAQLRWYCGLSTTDLRTTLSNLATLINVKNTQSPLDNTRRTLSTSSLDTEINERRNQSFTLPTQNFTSERQNLSHTVAQSEVLKTSLSSSLDRGLNKSPPNLVLNSQSKRICKSQENAIYDKALASSKNDFSTLNDESVNESVSKYNNELKIKNSNSTTTLDKMAVESNIEITTPTSFSKSKNVTDSLDSTESVRDHSSNSISSCEMAISCVQIEGDEIPSDDHIQRAEIFNEYPVTSGISDIQHAKTIKVEDKKSNLESDESSSNKVISIKENLVPESVYRSEKFSESENISEKTEQKTELDSEIQKTKLMTNYSQHDEVTYEARMVKDMEIQSEHLQTGDKQTTDHQMLDGIMETHTTNEQNELLEFRTSSEYLDLMKQSSNNVFARTEALANKKTSFKVMKQPRL